MELYQQIGLPPGVFDRPWRERKLMPRHDYKCPGCGRVAEFQIAPRSTESVALLPFCPKCGCAMEKQWAAPAFTIKGFNAKNGYA